MKILVIGDGCVDEYRYGQIKRVNPEAPAPLLSFELSEEKMGMAFNVAQNLRSFGAEVTLAVPAELSRKIRYVDRRTGQQLLRVDTDVVAQPYLFEHGLPAFDAIVISDYNKGFVQHSTIQNLRRKFDGPIYMDTKKTDLASFRDVYIKINQRELQAAVSLPGADRLIVTHGSKGCEYRGIMHPVKAIEVVDVCGAGDVFLSAMVATHLKTGDMAAAVAFANEKAALSCQSMGAVCVS